MSVRRGEVVAGAIAVLAGGCSLVIGIDDIHKPSDAGDIEGGISASSSGGSGSSSGGSGSGSGSGGGPGSPADAGTDDARAGFDAMVPAPDGGCGLNYVACGPTCVPSDTHNCGVCGHDCTHLPHASGTVTCTVTGQCSFGCTPGWAHCSARPDDGCETDVTQPSHCGGCSNVCSTSTPYCSVQSSSPTAWSYSCAASCPSTSPTPCGSSCVDTSTNPQNCAGCGHSCNTTIGNALPTCSSGTCGFTCSTGYSSCDGGCVDEQTDGRNCGGCGPSFACGVGASCRRGACAACSPTCAGTGCCGASCQTTHTDGLNHAFYDCAAAGTMNLTEAQGACAAYGHGGCTSETLACGDAGTVGFDCACASIVLPTTSYCWAYSGPNAGKVFSFASSFTGGCPTTCPTTSTGPGWQ